MKPLALVFAALVFSLHATGQHSKPAEETAAKDNSLISYIKEGEINGHIRNFFMATQNSYGNDYHANAIGGVLRYETKPFKGFQAGVAGIFTYRLFSSDLNESFAHTARPSRWEQELFDVVHKANYADLDRLEELYIKYAWNESYVTYGKIPVEYTPLLNLSDGRMKPFAFEGGWLHHRIQSMRLDAAWLHRLSPRSTTEWLAMDEAIGLADEGLQPNGLPAEYREHVPSAGLGVVHIGKQINGVTVDFWNFHLDKVTNTSWLQLEYITPWWQVGAIYSYQIPQAYQQRVAYEHRYVQPDENGQVASFMVKFSERRSQFKVAYSRAFATGRYLFSKELGRDQFYTSIPRSRMEGLGGLDVVALGYQYQRDQLDFHLDATTTFGASTGNYALNKYNIDDYYQINTRLHYTFSNFLNGLHMELLYIWKQNKKEHAPQLIAQRSDYNQINFITNFNF